MKEKAPHYDFDPEPLEKGIQTGRYKLENTSENDVPLGIFTLEEKQNLRKIRDEIQDGRHFDQVLDSPSHDGFSLTDITHGDMTELSRKLFALAEQQSKTPEVQSLPPPGIATTVFEASNHPPSPHEFHPLEHVIDFFHHLFSKQ